MHYFGPPSKRHMLHLESHRYKKIPAENIGSVQYVLLRIHVTPILLKMVIVVNTPNLVGMARRGSVWFSSSI